jgi:hypothetical protein
MGCSGNNGFSKKKIFPWHLSHGYVDHASHVDLQCLTLLKRREKPLSSGREHPFKITTPEVLYHVRSVIQNTITPSWLPSLPQNFGDSAAGKLKADEWRILLTVHLPIALVSLWGGRIAQPPHIAEKLRQVLYHTMNLVSAIHIACLRTMTLDRANAYRQYIAAWVKDLPSLYHSVEARTNNHMAFHIHDFLLLFGPVRSWWCFPFERLIGHLQRLPHNHKFGQCTDAFSIPQFSHFSQSFRSTGIDLRTCIHSSSQVAKMACTGQLPSCNQGM